MSEPLVAGLDRGALLELHRALCLARAAEERLEELHRQGHVKGDLQRSRGQEAGPVGAAFAMDRRDDGTGDVLAHTESAAGALFVFGASPEDFFRQHLARATSPTGGKEAGVRWEDYRRGFVGPVSPLGTMIEVMAGITLSFTVRGEGRVGLVLSGDGAAATGAWHEGLNFAAVRRCPLVLVVESNRHAFSTPMSRTSRLVSLVQKAPGYGIGAESVDGTDVLAVYQAVARGARRARAGEGVQMVEVRHGGRHGPDREDRGEQEDARPGTDVAEKDPLERYAGRMVGEGWATAQEVDDIRSTAVEVCARASTRVLDDPEPAGPAALDGVTTDGRLPVPWTRLTPPDPRRSSEPA